MVQLVFTTGSTVVWAMELLDYTVASAMAWEACTEVSRTQLTASTAEWDSLVAVLLTAPEDFSEPIILSTRPCIRQASQATVLTAQARVCFAADSHQAIAENMEGEAEQFSSKTIS
uniref:Tick transposon n=1 Tax=Rhipicephalus appendiculatus TaxID=34631 RepID=A0A131YBL1_RHIAP